MKLYGGMVEAAQAKTDSPENMIQFYGMQRIKKTINFFVIP